MKDMQFDIVPGEQPGTYVGTMTPLDLPEPNPEDAVYLRVCWDTGAWTHITKDTVITELTTENENLKKMLHDIPCQACDIGHPLANCTCEEHGRRKL